MPLLEQIKISTILSSFSVSLLHTSPPVLHRGEIAKRTFSSLQKTLTDRRLPEKTATASMAMNDDRYFAPRMRVLNAIASKMLARITRRTTAEEAASPTCPVILWIRDRLGELIRMDGDRLVRRVLAECVPSTPSLIFSDVPNLRKS